MDTQKMITRISANTSRILALSIFPMLLVGAAFAQGLGTIRGTVTDPSAASVPNAAVHVTGGGQTRDEKTDAKGAYTVSVPPGQYTLRITAPGFVTTTQTNVTVTSGQ